MVASELSHREQAENNERAARDVEEKYPDWAVTMCFYAALHWIERYAKIEECDIESEYPDWRSPHERRREYIGDIARKLGNRALRNAYENLEKDSRTARYLINIRTNAYRHYTTNKRDVNKSFQNLQIVKQLLS